MAKLTLVSVEDENEGGLTVSLTQEVETMQDLLAFFSEASRAIGFRYVDRMAYSTDRGETVWSKF